MLRDNLVDRLPCLKNPRPNGAESSLTGNASSPFQVEPAHHSARLRANVVCLQKVRYTAKRGGAAERYWIRSAKIASKGYAARAASGLIPGWATTLGVPALIGFFLVAAIWTITSGATPTANAQAIFRAADQKHRAGGLSGSERLPAYPGPRVTRRPNRLCGPIGSTWSW